MTAADVCKECGYLGQSIDFNKVWTCYFCWQCGNMWFGFPKIVEGQESEVVL